MRSSFFALISLAAAAHAAPPARVEIEYEVLRDGKDVAQVVHRMEHGAGAYRLTETWRGKGVYALRGEIRRSSRGAVAADGLHPRHYADERTGRAAEAARFDPAARTLTLERKGDKRTEPLPRDAHDRLSFLFDFAFDVPRGGEVALHVADGRGVSEHVYRVAGRERVTVPAGEFDALKLVRRKGGGEAAEIWLAAARHYLPVRIRITREGGERVDQVATRISAP